MFSRHSRTKFIPSGRLNGKTSRVVCAKALSGRELDAKRTEGESVGRTPAHTTLLRQKNQDSLLQSPVCALVTAPSQREPWCTQSIHQFHTTHRQITICQSTYLSRKAKLEFVYLLKSPIFPSKLPIL